MGYEMNLWIANTYQGFIDVINPMICPQIMLGESNGGSSMKISAGDKYILNRRMIALDVLHSQKQSLDFK